MPDWAWWLVIAAVMAGGEILTLGFFLGPIALAALLATLVAVAGGSVPLQIGTFVAGSIASLAIVRPIARRHMHTPPQIRTGTAALVGKTATVLERIANQEGVGCVRIDGEVWTARAYMDDETYEAGARVQVVEIRGATALVTD